MGSETQRTSSRMGMVLAPLAWVYGKCVAARNRRFDRGEGVGRLPEPVISVGNIVLGGAGKTPVCRHIISTLRAGGGNPAIALRGYGAGPDGVSDEAEEYAAAFADLPRAVGANRVMELERLRGTTTFDSIVLDDGFQHRRIARDLDLVVIDATQPGLAERLLPAGRLREPAAALARADGVLITRATTVDENLARQIEDLHGAPPIAWTEHAWGDALDVHWRDRPSEARSLGDIAGASVAVSLGVGHPSSICTAIDAAGMRIVHNDGARDHQLYSGARVQSLFAQARSQGADAIVLTPKDWMKVRTKTAFFENEIPIWVPRLELRFLDGQAAFDELVVRAGTLRQ